MTAKSNQVVPGEEQDAFCQIPVTPIPCWCFWILRHPAEEREPLMQPTQQPQLSRLDDPENTDAPSVWPTPPLESQK
eukprot:gene25913-biopygen11688